MSMTARLRRLLLPPSAIPSILSAQSEFSAMEPMEPMDDALVFFESWHPYAA